MGDKTFWNGEPTKAERVRVRLPLDADIPPTYWYYGLGGTERDAVRVQYNGMTFFLDDADGSGWDKVISGGSPQVGHRGLPIKCEVLDAAG